MAREKENAEEDLEEVEEKQKIGLKEDALNQPKWRDGVQAIAEEMGVNPAISAERTRPDRN